MYYFIMNKTSGRKSSGISASEIRKICEAHGAAYRIYATEYAGHTGELCSRIEHIKDDDKTVIIVGGDGSLNEAVNGFRDISGLKFGIIPGGSGNDFARGLGIKGDSETILKSILDNGAETPVDLGRVTADGCISRLFCVSSGFGLDALVCKKVDEGKLKKVLNSVCLGSLTYTLETVITLFTMRIFSLKAASDNAEFSVKKVIYCAQMNTPFEGGGVPMAPGASARDGKLSACMAAEVPRIKTFFYLPLLLKAKHENLKCFRLFESCRVSYELSEPAALHTDGEYLGEAKSLVYETLPGKLRLVNPLQV